MQSHASLDGQILKFSIFSVSYSKNWISKIVYCFRCVMACKICFTKWNAKIALLRASMVVTYYIKLFRTGADRHNGFLMPLLLLVAERVISLRKRRVTRRSFAPRFSTIERNLTYSRFSCRFITYSIRIRHLYWCKWRYCKNKAKEIDCISFREVDAILISWTRIPECEGSI